MTLLDQLRGKSRRRVVVPVQVRPVGGDELARIVEIEQRAAEALVAGSVSADVEALADEVAAIRSAAQVEVAFTALTPSDFEKFMAAYPDEEGGIEWGSGLPVLAALCADDEDLQDDQVWTELLGSGGWAYGEVEALRASLFRLNTDTPAPHYPKG